MKPRRAQTPVHVRSDRAAAKLAVLTRQTGRSQVEVIEDALERFPTVAESPLTADQAARMARIEAILARIPKDAVMSMKEFDALEYDELGDLR